jgi:lipopolysaccharide biosynthesis glycosyltransferase
MVNIVYASNNKYAPYLCVSLYSLIENVSDSNEYNVTVLETDISNEFKDIISSLQAGKNNVHINFINMDSELKNKGVDSLFCHLYFTKEMYLRIFIPDILQNIDKAVYIDIDTIITGDVAELYNIDLENNYIGAAKDFNTIVNYKYFKNIPIYFDEFIKLKNIKEYFNSGVLLMNLVKLREISIVEKTYNLLDKYKEFLYPDQDILNLICEGHVKIISNKWNFVPLINVALIHDETFQELAAEWSQGLCDRKIIHYISEEKPWNFPKNVVATGWWKMAKKTPVYQMLLKDYFSKHPQELKIN